MAEGDARAALIAALERANADAGYPVSPGIHTNLLADALRAAGYVLVSRETLRASRDWIGGPGRTPSRDELERCVAELDRVLGGEGAS